MRHPLKIVRIVSASAALLALATTAAAQSVAITNPSFEANVIADGAFSVLVPSGWQLYDPQGIVNQNANSVGVIRPNVPQSFFPGGATDGAQAALVFLAGPVDAPAGLQQTLVNTLAADTLYTLTVDVGNIASGTSLPGSSDGGGIFYDLDGFPGYRIELLAGGTVLGFDQVSAGVIPEGEWRSATLAIDSALFPALQGQALSVRLINLDTAGTVAEPAIEVDFDNVRLVASAVPEPRGWAMWAAGLAALGFLARRRSVKR